MRNACWTCHRPSCRCFCSSLRPFQANAHLAMIVHPREVRSTVGTAWIVRRSISNLQWFQSKGVALDSDPRFLEMLENPSTTPLLVFPGPQALNLCHATAQDWESLTSYPKKHPLFVLLDGTWTQAQSMLKMSARLRALPRVSFETTHESEYRFKKQPDSHCLSTVESVHRLLEVLDSRGWASLPTERSHDRMIEIFRSMVLYQVERRELQISPGDISVS